MQINTINCKAGEILPLSNTVLAGAPSHTLAEIPIPLLKVGTRLMLGEQEIFKVVGRVLLQGKQQAHAQACPLLKALTTVNKDTLDLNPQKHGYALAWITLSDKGYIGQREDTSGPSIGELLAANIPICHEQGFLLPDEIYPLRSLLVELSLGQGYDLICTTGGTGLGPRDVSVEATLALLDRRLQGFEQLMMQTSLGKTPHASISRAVAGTIGQSLCINLPGSKKAVQENLEALLPALPHALAKLLGDKADCATIVS